jgi:hypothetical protein
MSNTLNAEPIVPGSFPGIYKIKALFWKCYIDDVDNTVDVDEKFETETTINIIEPIPFGVFMEKCLSITNSMINGFLNKLNIDVWLPARILTFDFHEESNTFEICYYHRQCLYETLFESGKSKQKQHRINTDIDLNYFYDSYYLSDKHPEIYKK